MMFGIGFSQGTATVVIYFVSSKASSSPTLLPEVIQGFFEGVVLSSEREF